MSVTPIYFDDLFVGRTIETEWHEMTRAAIVDFAAEYDPQPFHLSEEGGERSAFGELVERLSEPGGYFEDSAPARSSRHARDPEQARRLWEVSEDLVGLRTNR